MAYIGLYSATGLGAFTTATTNEQALFGYTTWAYTAGASEEVFKAHLYLTGSAGTIEVGLYDITGGYSGATKVGSYSCVFAGAGAPSWNEYAVGPWALTEGNVYAVAWAVASGTPTMYRAYSDFAVNRHSTLTGASALPSSWTSGSTLNQKYAIALETQASGATTYPQNRGLLLGTGTIGQGNGFGYKRF